MDKYWRYLTYVLRHKWFVFVECWKLGIPVLGVLHDWSKFLPDEFGPYAEYFYGGPHRPWSDVTAGEKYEHGDLMWRTSKEGVQTDFDEAWLKHQHRNKHHWQSYILRNDNGEVKYLLMPYRYVLEMVADWKGAGRALGKPDTLAWYLKNHDKMLLHPGVRCRVERLLGAEFLVQNTQMAATEKR